MQGMLDETDPLSWISTRRKNVEPQKVERIPTIRGSTSFLGDNSISQSDCWKVFLPDIFPPSGDPALKRRSLSFREAFPLNGTGRKFQCKCKGKLYVFLQAAGLSRQGKS